MPGSKAESISNSFEGYILGGLSANSIIFSLAMTRIRVFKQARFQFQSFSKGRPSTLFASQSLEVLERPWPGGVTGDLLAIMLLHADFAGNAYITLIDGQIVVMRPDWVDILLADRRYTDTSGHTGTVGLEKVGYLYYQGGKNSGVKPVAFLADEVTHFAPIPDPLANYRGMSWLTPVVREIQADQAAQTHKLKFWENSASPNLAVKLQTTDINQFNAFKEKMDEQHQGLANAYQTLYLGAGADVTVIGKDMQQMDFAKVIAAGEVRLAAAAGVHPSVAGLSEGLQGSSLNAGNFCVPLDTEALTSTGWRKYWDLKVGDAVLGYDTTDERCRWTPITGITPLFDAPIVEFGNKDFKVRCTENHSWIGRWRGRSDRPVQSMRPTWAAKQGPLTWDRLETRLFREGHDLLLAAEADTPNLATITAPEAALIGWLVTDGSIERSVSTGRTSQAKGTKVGFRGRIFQKNHLDELLGDLADAGVEYTSGMKPDGVWWFSLPPEWMRDVWDRARLDKRSLTEFVLDLGNAQRDAFLRAGMLAEGWLGAYNRTVEPKADYGPWYRWGFAQNEGDTFEAFALAATLSGYAVRHHHTNARCKPFHLGKPKLDAKYLKMTPAGVVPVWCIETGLGTWVMRQGPVVAITGNSAARRQFSDITLADLWSNVSASLEVLVPPPHGGARLWYDIRDIPFLREDMKDQAAIQSAHATAIRELFMAGFTAESCVAAVNADDLTLLVHTGVYSIQVQTPGTNSRLLSDTVDVPPLSPDSTGTAIPSAPEQLSLPTAADTFKSAMFEMSQRSEVEAVRRDDQVLALLGAAVALAARTSNVTVNPPSVVVERSDIHVDGPNIDVQPPNVTVESLNLTVEGPQITVEPAQVSVQPPNVTVEPAQVNVTVEPAEVNVTNPLTVEGPTVNVAPAAVAVHPADVHVNVPPAPTPPVPVRKPAKRRTTARRQADGSVTVETEEN
jgi:hypothetical protein